MFRFDIGLSDGSSGHNYLLSLRGGIYQQMQNMSNKFAGCVARIHFGLPNKRVYLAADNIIILFVHQFITHVSQAIIIL